MFKFIDKKKICIFLIAVITLFTLFGTTAINAFAYRPYDEYRVGSNGKGAYPVNDTPIMVKGMKLIFDITDFPQVDESGINYRSTVTSEYTLYNPTNETVVEKLVIPELERPNYFNEDFDLSPKVKVNGELKETQIRHSPTASDEWYSDNFFSPGLPVHKYKITSNVSYAYLKGDIITDYTKARYISDGYDEFSCNYTSDGDNTFYILGDETAVNLDALSFYDYNNFNLVKISDKFELEKVEMTTLKDLVLSYNSASSGISDLDWYNGILAKFSNGESVCAKYSLSQAVLKKYYVYSVEVEPNGEIVTSITQPTLPDVNGDRECYYNFDTLCSYNWKGFGKLEIQINTDFYIDYCPSNFQKSETGYTAVYPMSPNALTFSLNRNYSGNPVNNYPGGSNTEYTVGGVIAGMILISILVRFALLFFGGGITFIVLMVKRSKQK